MTDIGYFNLATLFKLKHYKLNIVKVLYFHMII